MATIISGLFISGLLFSAGPCLASCGPLLVSYIAGTQKNTYKALVFYTLFSLARISVYLVLGLAVFFVGSAALESLISPWVAIIGGIFIVCVGLAMCFGRGIRFKSLAFLEKANLFRDLKNPFVFGLIFGLLPCAPLVAILTYIGLVSRNWQQALLYAFSFGLGTFMSLLLFVSILSGFVQAFLKKEKHRAVLRIVSGIVLIVLGVQIVWRGL